MVASGSVPYQLACSRRSDDLRALLSERLQAQHCFFLFVVVLFHCLCGFFFSVGPFPLALRGSATHVFLVLYEAFWDEHSSRDARAYS